LQTWSMREYIFSKHVKLLSLLFPLPSNALSISPSFSLSLSLSLSPSLSLFISLPLVHLCAHTLNYINGCELVRFGPGAKCCALLCTEQRVERSGGSGE